MVRKLLLVLVLMLAGSAVADAGELALVAERRQIVDALGRNDIAGLVAATGNLAGYLDPAEVDCSNVNSGVDLVLVRAWELLARPDGVRRARQEWYPAVVRYSPEIVASAQILVGGLKVKVWGGEMEEERRAQLLDLLGAVEDWLTRTDFQDPVRFDRAIGLIQSWVIGTGKVHPCHLATVGHTERILHGDDGLRVMKAVLKLYGLDVDSVLASVKTEQFGESAVRTSMTVLGVPLMVGNDVELVGKWWVRKRGSRMVWMGSSRAAMESSVLWATRLIYLVPLADAFVGWLFEEKP